MADVCVAGSPRPGVIDLYGTTGGLAVYRAALLASRGLTTLALAYFNYDDLPKQLSPLDLDYFDVRGPRCSGFHKSLLPAVRFSCEVSILFQPGTQIFKKRFIVQCNGQQSVRPKKSKEQ